MPVIVLTARGEIEDRVVGLDAGAGLPRQAVLTRRARGRVRAQLRVVAQASASTLRGEDIEVNLLTRKVRRGEQSVALSTTEFELLVYLLRHHGQVLSREQILSACGATSTIPRPTSWTSTSATCAESSAVLRILRRSSRCARSAIAWAARADRCDGRFDRLARVGLRWRLAGWVAVGRAGVHRDHVRGRLPRHRGPAAPPDRPGDRGRRQRAGAQPRAHGRSLAAGGGRDAARYIRGQPFSASSTLLFAVVPGAGTSTNRPELFSDAAPDNGETAAEQARTASRAAADRADRLLHPAAARRRRPAPAQARRALARRAARDGGGRASPGGVAHAQASVAAFILAGILALAGALLASYLIGTRVSRRCAAWRPWRRASTPATCTRASTTPAARATRCACWPTPSTTCSIA